MISKKKLFLIVGLFFLYSTSYSKDYRAAEEIIKNILSGGNDTSSENTEEPGEVQDSRIEGRETGGITGATGERGRPTQSAGRDALMLKTGTQLYNSGLPERSLTVFNDLIREFPNSPFADNARVWAGRISIDLNNYDEALNYFRGVNSNSGEFPASLYYTAEAFRYKGDLDRSIETFKRLYNSYPENEFADKAMLISGRLYLQNGKGYQALESVIGIIRNYSNRDTVDDAYYLMAKIYERDPVLKDIETARRIYRAFLRKAEDGDPFFKDSPLITAVKRDLDRLEHAYFRLER